MKKSSIFVGLALVSGWALADVISLNFGTDRSGSSITGTEQVGFVEGVVGDRWNNFTGASGSNVGSLRSVDQDVVDGLSVSWTSRNVWGWAGSGDAVVTDLAIKDYLDDGDGVTVTVAGVPYASYDVVIYTGCDNANKQFSPFCVNGVWYAWDATAGEVVGSAAGRLDSWGLTRGLTAEYGRNTLRVRGLSGSTLTIRTSQPATGTSGMAFRGTLGAVQIVETADADALPAPDFMLSGVPGEAPQGWFTAFNGQFNDVFQRIGPSGYDVLATANGYAPYAAYQLPNDFTCSVLLDVTDVNVAEKDATLLDFGNGGGGRYYLQLLKLRGTDDVQLAWCYNNTSVSGGYSVQDAVTLENVPQGYHLYTITFSTSAGFTLQLDDGEVLSSREQSLTGLAAGLQIGDVHGGKSQSVAADAMGVCAMMMWNGVLGTDVRSRLWDVYRPTVGSPIPYNYSENLRMRANSQFGTVSIPTMTDTGTHFLGADSGTMHVKAKSVVNVNAVEFMNSEAETSEFVFNLDGELNVTSVSTDWNVYPERGTRGILTGHWHGQGTYNIRGVLVGEGAYWETVYSGAAQTINIDGGRVRVRGLSANNDNSTLNVVNGGTLEIADWNGSGNGAIKIHAGRGTLRAYAYGGSTGWTQPSRAGTLLTFDDAETGTTLDPNGLTIALQGATSGAGRVVIEDTSDAGDGTVAFDSLNAMSGALVVKGAATLRAAAANGFVGTFDVQDAATLDLGANRPEGAIAFAEGTTVCLCESLADEDGVVNLAFTGAPRVVMVRPDGVTPVEDARVVEEDGVAKIRYTPLAEPVVSGSACWYDFEFEDRSRASTGMNKGSLSVEDSEGIGTRSGDTANDFRDDHALFTAAQSWLTITYPAQWSAAIYATVPQRANCAVMTFGTKDGGLIGLLAGAEENEVLLVRTTGDAPYEVLAKMTVPNAATSQHLYVFSKRSRTIDIYLDGVLWNSYTSPTDITLGSGFQIGSVHGSPGNTGIARFGVSTFFANPADFTMDAAPAELLASYIGMLRLYDTALNSTALAALAAEFPYVSPNGLFARTVSGTDEAWTAGGAWTQVTETGSVAVDAPTGGAMLQLNAGAEATALTVALDEEVHFEALAFGGAGAVTLKKGTGELMNDGKTTVNTAVTIEYGAASVAGGPLVMGAHGSLTFDYRAFPVDLMTPNQTIPLTGLSTAAADVRLVAPARTFGRTFTLSFNAETNQWQLTVARRGDAVMILVH